MENTVIILKCWIVANIRKINDESRVKVENDVKIKLEPGPDDEFNSGKCI